MSPLSPIRLAAAGIDLSGRVTRTAAVVGSPAANAETTIASLTVAQNVQANLGVILLGYAAWTVGTDGVSVTLKLHQTDSSGTTVKSSGAMTAVAANLGSDTIIGVDTAPVLPGQVYIMTMTVASGSAQSTVSAVELVAIVI